MTHSPNPTTMSREAEAWNPATVKPDVGRKIVCLYDDGSGAALFYTHDHGVIDSDGDDYAALSSDYSLWAYLPDDFELHCELHSEPGEHPMHLPVIRANPHPATAGGKPGEGCLEAARQRSEYIHALAREAGREMAGNQVGALVEAFGEVAVAGARIATEAYEANAYIIGRLVDAVPIVETTAQTAASGAVEIREALDTNGMGLELLLRRLMMIHQSASQKDNAWLRNTVASAISAIQSAALARPVAEEPAAPVPFGYYFHNPDSGWEISDSHPIESGECDDATEIEELTPERLKELLIDAWDDAEEARAERDEMPASPSQTLMVTASAIREALDEVDVHEEAENYEFRGDADYTPNDNEKTLLEDFGCGLIGKIEEALHSMFAAPKANGVGTGGEGLEVIQHVKTQGLYEVLTRDAQVQTDTPLEDYAFVAVYRNAITGATWVRPVSEMDDGRFVTLRATPSQGNDEGAR